MSLHSNPRTSCTWQILDDDHTQIFGTHNHIQAWSTFLFSCERYDQSTLESFLYDILHYQVLGKGMNTYFIGWRKVNISFLKNFQKPNVKRFLKLKLILVDHFTITLHSIRITLIFYELFVMVLCHFNSIVEIPQPNNFTNRVFSYKLIDYSIYGLVTPLALVLMGSQVAVYYLEWLT